jgi:hypothetical protein
MWLLLSALAVSCLTLSFPGTGKAVCEQILAYFGPVIGPLVQVSSLYLLFLLAFLICFPHLHCCLDTSITPQIAHFNSPHHFRCCTCSPGLRLCSPPCLLIHISSHLHPGTSKWYVVLLYTESDYFDGFLWVITWSCKSDKSLFHFFAILMIYSFPRHSIANVAGVWRYMKHI